MSLIEYNMMRNAFDNEDYEDNYYDYCSEEYDEDIYDVDEDAEWPNRGRFGNLPALSFLKANYHPPITKPQPLESWMYEQNNKCDMEVKALEQEKQSLESKAAKVEAELKEAEQVPKTYSAAKWGATSARDALVKRLVKDLESAYDLVNTQKQKINELTKKNETVKNLIKIQEAIENHYKSYIEERNKGWEEMYGKQKPLTDLKQLEWEYEADLIEETASYVWYHFPNDVNMEKCLRALAVAEYKVIRIDDRDFEVTKK